MKRILTLVLIASITLSGCSLFRKKSAAEPTPKPEINEPVNVIDISERPYLSLVPRNDGRELTLILNNLPKPATEMEYELEYQAGTLLQGAFGAIDLSSPAFPLETKILLGSCSAGGACTYHEDVQGGSLTLKFRADQNYALKDEWRFLTTRGAKGQFSSRDSKFQLDAGTALDRSSYLVIMQTSGLPGPIEGQLLAGPYGIYPSNGLPAAGSGDLSLRLSEDASQAAIYGWNGTEWVAFDTQVADKTATAEVDFMSVYIAY